FIAEQEAPARRGSVAAGAAPQRADHPNGAGDVVEATEVPPGGQGRSERERLPEVRGSIFAAPEGAAFAHAVSTDGHLGAGIAEAFVQEFGSELREAVRTARAPLGTVVAVRCTSGARRGAWIFNLVTKTLYHQKPELH